ncbi:MAG: hypothetical protein COB04_03855 [Gammaproteobacteria bacterium]|nr:MAG: hypothetical protein COB04_03855 [Gammaproteobacteria bacterium]
MPKKDVLKRASSKHGLGPQPLPESCPCGSQQLYSECCQLLHQGAKQAETAVQLMRARYSAHVVGAIDYIVNTTLPVQQAYLKTDDIADWASRAQWTGLIVINQSQGQQQDDQGWVEFIASYNDNAEPKQHQENSYFKRFEQRWYFVYPIEGLLTEGRKASRNDPCPCGSGGKYKKCCGK